MTDSFIPSPGSPDATPQCRAKSWDSYDVYLFDIDGTLLHCTDAVHYFAFCEILTRIVGSSTNLDGVVAHGNTDIGIIRDALALANVPDQQWRTRRKEINDTLCEFAEKNKSDLCIEVLPEVEATLSYLQSCGAVLGVATGNLERIGRLKLAHCDLLRHFEFGGYSDDYEHRSDVFAGALAKAQLLVGEHASVCVVGDTPEDIRSARKNGIDVIAVATGTYTAETLRVEEPTWCINSLADLLASV